jgi:hypothetical protein
MKRLTGIFIIAVVAAATLSACVTRYATSTSDEHVCVFDGSERGGQRLKFQIPPGADSKKIDSNDKVVKIPASNRFYFVTQQDSLRDPGAPEVYTGNAAGGTPVIVTGQVRFRFNLTKACEWFSKHGRRNAKDGTDLGFNARGNPKEVAQEGWFKFLNENFGDTMQATVDSPILANYNWAALHYNYATNSNEAGIVPAGAIAEQATRVKLAGELATAFTKQLEANLGGQYFCGIEGPENECGPLQFRVRYAGPGPDSSLVKDREKVEQTKQQLETARLQGDLQRTQQQTLIEAENLKAALLEVQVRTADAQAKIDTAKCRQYAPYGLDCEGKRPPVIVNGQAQ